MEININTRFDEFGHEEDWKNKVAEELNILLRHSIGDNDFQKTVFSIVHRVAKFENISPLGTVK